MVNNLAIEKQGFNERITRNPKTTISIALMCTAIGTGLVVAAVYSGCATPVSWILAIAGSIFLLASVFLFVFFCATYHDIHFSTGVSFAGFLRAAPFCN
jgi:hypothetical protein